MFFFLEKIKGEIVPQISPRVGENLQLGEPPHGFGEVPETPRTIFIEMG
jgi:hypothetical protein